MEGTVSSRLIYMVGLLDVLRASGGALRSIEVFERLRLEGIARPLDLSTIQVSGEARFTKEVRFARLELVHAGLLEPDDQAGFWSLSEEGWATFLTVAEARALVARRRHGRVPLLTRPPRIGPTTGPRPVNFTSSISRSVSRISWTYALRYGATELWKIGHTQDIGARLSDVNKHLPIELTGVSWTLFAKRSCDSSNAAYDMEQRLFSALSEFRTQGERVRCSVEQLTAVWRQCSLPDIG